MSLKSRIREARREVERHDSRREVEEDSNAARIDSKNRVDDAAGDGEESTPTVEQLRDALLRKASNGRNSH